MKKIYLFILLLSLPLFAITAYAASPVTPVTGSGAFATIESGIIKATTSAVGKMQSIAILWLSAFVTAQFLLTNLGLLKSGADIEAVIGKLMGSLLWFGFCFYVVLHGASFIENVGADFMKTAGLLTGAGSFEAGDIMDKGITIGANLISTVKAVAGLTDLSSVMIAGICAVFILCVMALIACKIFLIKIELTLIVMMSPLSFSLLGLNALKDQGIAPFKALLSLMYRIILLGVLVASVSVVCDEVNASLLSMYSNASYWQKVTGMGTGVWPTLLGATTVFLIFGYLVFKSDSIASNLASGTTSLGTADVASAAALGAAAGAAVATGGASAVQGAGKTGQSMGDFLKSMGGSGASLSNASPGGLGPTALGPAPAKMSAGPGSATGNASANALLSRGGSGGAVGAASGGAPQRSTGQSAASSNGAAGSSAASGAGGSTGNGSEPISSSAAQPAGDAGSLANIASAGAVEGGANSGPEASPSSMSETASAGTGSSGAEGQNAKSVPTGAPTRAAGLANGVDEAPASVGNNAPAASGGAPQRRAPPTPAPLPGSGADASIGGPAGSPQVQLGGSGANAGIGPPASSVEQQLADSQTASGQPPQKPGVMDRLSELNQHIAQESASVGVSISTHHTD